MLKMSWKSAEGGKPAEERKSGTSVTEAIEDSSEERSRKEYEISALYCRRVSEPIPSVGETFFSSSTSP